MKKPSTPGRRGEKQLLEGSKIKATLSCSTINSFTFSKRVHTHTLHFFKKKRTKEGINKMTSFLWMISCMYVLYSEHIIYQGCLFRAPLPLEDVERSGQQHQRQGDRTGLCRRTGRCSFRCSARDEQKGQVKGRVLGQEGQQTGLDGQRRPERLRSFHWSRRRWR